MNLVNILCGTKELKSVPWQPFDKRVCFFLEEWSSALRNDVEAKRYPDVMTFAFWIRKGNILKRKEMFEKKYLEGNVIGRGLAFHIAPSNVPVNGMYTYVFGLLAGNANVVRMPSKEFPQIRVMCRVLSAVLARKQHHEIFDRTLLLKYSKESQYTKMYSSKCDLRIIWGGDATIAEVRQVALSPRSKEITFADRYSFGIISQRAIELCSEDELVLLAERFYNDTFLMDQNACSTPHLICWWRDGKVDSVAPDRFWNAVRKVAEKYDFADIKSSEKYADLCEQIMKNREISSVRKYLDNILYVCDVESLGDKTVTMLRGRYGLFFQYKTECWGDLNPLNDVKVQTCAYFGISPQKIVEWIVDAGLYGIDRIVPFGKTLDIDLTWDGYDLITEMSRLIGIN